MKWKLALACGALGSSLLGVSAHGGFIMQLVSGTATVTVEDNGLLDTNSDAGVIQYYGSVGAFSTTITIGTSNWPGEAQGALLQITSIVVRNTAGGAGTLQIVLGDTDYTAPESSWPLLLQSSIGGTLYNSAAGDYVTFQSYADASDAQFGTETTPGSQQTVSTGGFLFSIPNSDAATDFAYDTQFSMTNVTTVRLSAKGQANISGTTSMVPVPEPASLGVLGLGVLGLLRRRR